MPKPTDPLTQAQVAKRLKAKGLKASPEELEELTRMMNAELAREAAQAYFDSFKPKVGRKR